MPAMRIESLLRTAVVLALASLVGCLQPITRLTSAPDLHLPQSLAAERDRLSSELSLARERVIEFFAASGFEVPPGSTIDTVVVFEETNAARESLASTFGVNIEDIPETFAGTVVGETLYLVSRGAYRISWEKLYPGWPWHDTNYLALMTHELAHKAHESIAISEFGAADAMGPTWFFEGLAVACAGQFEDDRLPLTLTEIKGLVGDGNVPPVSYPLYGQLFRSLANQFDKRMLIAGAGTEDFPSGLLAGVP